MIYLFKQRYKSIQYTSKKIYTKKVVSIIQLDIQKFLNENEWKISRDLNNNYKIFFNLCLMIRLLITFILLTLSFSYVVSQESYFLTPKNKAYLYHTVRKSPILESNIGRYIDFQGEEVRFPNGEINFDSTELIIINNPEILKIYTDEIRRSPKGIIAELSNKMAIWELNKTLMSFRNNSLEKDANESNYQLFISLVSQKLPDKAFKRTKNEVYIHPKIEKLSNPTLTFNDKVAMLDGFSKWSEEEKKMTIVAFNFAVVEWVQMRSQEIFSILGGESNLFQNILTAAGDGSSTSGLFEEREKDERGRFNRGLPRAIGLFPYQPYIGIKPNSKKQTQEVLPMGYTIHEFKTVGNGRETNIQLDVWGYNSEKQTTVVIQKGRYSYPLFGSETTRFLSPDSTYGGGMTYYTMINRVQNEIDELHEKIFGKKGIDYQIKYYEDLRDGKKLKIDKTSKEIGDIRTSQITTKTTKKGLKPSSQRKKRKTKQETVINLYNELKRIDQKIKSLKEEKEIILLKKQEMEKRFNHMRSLIGEQWVSFTEQDGLYIFEDSARFDLYTQEFTFPASELSQDAEVKLIAMPKSHLSNNYDEVMLHFSITDAIPDYTTQVNLRLTDQFDVDKYDLKMEKLFSKKDSLSIVEFFEALQDKNKKLEVISRGGVGKIKYEKLTIDYHPNELNHYPGSSAEEQNSSKESKEFKELRTTEVLIQFNRKITLQVNSYTDPVKSNFKTTNKKIQSLADKNGWSGNQLLSAYRSYSTLKKVKDELTVLASEYLSRESSAIVIDRLNKAIENARITVGKSSIKYKAF